MKSVIQQFIDKENENGLMLLDMPTGSGKTHCVLDFIHDYVVNQNGEKKIFFLTTLKKNLPTEELRGRFKTSEKEELFDQIFLRLENNVDCVCRFLDSEEKNRVKCEKIPKDIKNSQEFKNLRGAVEFKKNYCDKNKDKSSLEFFQERIEDAERKFRTFLKERLKEKFKRKSDRLKAIEEEPEWTWVGEMYPAALIKNKKIVFMTVNKFLVENDTIIEPSYIFYNNKIVEKSIIFIDEFDATKDTFLNVIIEEGIRGKHDFLASFLDIYDALKNRKFPAQLTRESKKSQEENKNTSKHLTPKELLSRFKEMAEQIYEEYHLEYVFKTKKGDAENRKKNFLFHDHRYHTISGEFPEISTNATEKVNDIVFGKDKADSDNSINVNKLLGQIRGFITYFQKGVGILAMNYQELRKKEQPDEDEISYDCACRSVLNIFGLKREQVEYLMNSMTKGSGNKTDRSAAFDLTFYEKGFQIYDFQDDTQHDMQSLIMMEKFTTTPEKLLLKICNIAKVVGISATATLESSLGNFDLKYIKNRLGDRYVEIDLEQQNRLKQQFDKATDGYDQVNIHVELIDTSGDYSQDSWKDIFADEESCSSVYELIENKISGKADSKNKKCFIQKRYLRIFTAYKYFAKQKDIRSFLCVLNRFPREDDGDLDLGLIKGIAKIINKHYSLGDEEEYIEILDGENFEERKREISEKLRDGKRKFIISVYQTIGNGQNLQYKIPLDVHCVTINEFKEKNEKDYDAIYLDYPTNLLVNVTKDSDENEFVKRIFQIKYLQEKSSISSDDAIELIKQAYQVWTEGNRRTSKPLSDKKCVRNLAARLMVQAVGRICRTNRKNRDIYIYVDSEYLDKIDISQFENKVVNKEFEKILECAKERNKQIYETNDGFMNRNLLKCERSYNFINSLLNDKWSDDSIENWKKLREIVLKYPTLNELPRDVISTNIVNNFYLELPDENSRVFYSQKDDFKDVELSLKKNEKCRNEISEQDVKLDYLMKLPYLKKMFEKKGFATEFKKGKYILSPILYNNIYKGALGEIVGCIFLGKYKISVKDILDKDLYELFDYQIKDGLIYFDMKHWKSSTKVDWNSMRDKIDNKLKKCGGKAAIILNLFAEESDHEAVFSHELPEGRELLEVPCIYHWEKDSKTGKENLVENLKAILEIQKFIQRNRHEN